MYSSTIGFRKLEKSDYNLGYTHVLKQLSDTCDISFEQFSNRFDEISKSPNHHIYVIRDRLHDKIIGSGTLFIEEKFIHWCKNVGHIEDIIVDEKYRGQGLGKDLIEFLVGEAQKYDCYKIILNCDEKNVGFYEKIGLERKNIQMALYFE